ncbi:MAG: hypothetical protein IKJ30_04525 [Bacilli bacterium]|nr:hypothetical protein [Bacilli bacterium]
MKRVMSKVVLSLMFALAFVFAGAATIEAAGYTPKQNVTVTAGEQGKVLKTTIEGSGSSKEVVYVVDSADAHLKLKYIKNNEGSYAFTSNISVVKCSAGGSCSAYSPAVNVDQLRAGGYTLALDGFEDNGYGHTKQTVVNVSGVVNGTDLSTLNSNYGRENALYVLIDYVAVKEYWKLFKGTQREIVAAYSEVITVVNLDKVNGYVTIESAVNGTTINALVSSSVKLTELKYIETDQIFNFSQIATDEVISLEEAFAKVVADNGLTANDVAIKNILNTFNPRPPKVGLAYETEFTITKDDGKHYYVLAKDEFGSLAIYDVSTPGFVSGNTPGNEGVGPNAADTQVGKIILVILVGVLVLAAVLVIIQKIVDHRRKLY